MISEQLKRAGVVNVFPGYREGVTQDQIDDAIVKSIQRMKRAKNA